MSLPVSNNLNSDSVHSEQPPSQQRRRGPKPSSKKRLEDFRYRKSYEAQARIHKEAFDDTNISLDSLLLALNELHLGTTKQAATVPVTTRGIGFLTSECHARAVQQVPRAEQTCDVNTLYRVSLAQEQLQLNQSQEHHLLPDPTTPQVLSQDLSLDPATAQEIRGLDVNFAVVTDLINSTGVTEVHQQEFVPFVPLIETQAGDQPVESTPHKRRRVTNLKPVPDPYAVTFNNLQETVNALSDVQTDPGVRAYFKMNNPIPGAVFDDSGLLLNPEDIIPPRYDRMMLKRDIRSAESFFGLLGSKMTSLLGKCNYTGKGNPSQLCGYYKEQFSIDKGFVFSSPHTRVRSARPIETSFLVRGALNMLGETPVDGLLRDQRSFSFREPIHQVQYLDVDWSGLVTRCLQKR